MKVEALDLREGVVSDWRLGSPNPGEGVPFLELTEQEYEEYLAVEKLWDAWQDRICEGLRQLYEADLRQRLASLTEEQKRERAALKDRL